MTETPFKAYQAEVNFDPIKSEGEGLIASAEANQNQFLESIHKRNADLFKYELADAERKDQRFEKLAQLSQTAAKIAAPLIQARTNEQLLKGAELYHDGLAEDQELRQAEFKRDEDQQLTEELINNEIIDEAEKKGEIDPFLKDKLKKIPRLQKLGFQKAMYGQEAKMYPVYREQNKSIPVRIQDSNGQWVDRALEDAKDPNEWEQINRRLIRGYIRPFATHDMPMVEEYLFKEMRKIEQDEKTKWTTARISQITSEDNLKADNGLKNNFSKDPGSVMKYALTEQHRFGSISAAHDNAIELVKADINLGFANSDDVKDLKTSKYIDKTTGETYVYGERFPRKIAALEEAIYERDKAIHQKKTDQETIAFKKDVTSFHDKLSEKLDKGEEITDKEIEIEQDRLVKIYGKRSTKLDAIKQDLTVEAKEIDRQTEEVQALADLGLLNTTELSKYNWKVVQKFQGVAQLQSQVQTETKEWLGRVEQLVKIDSKLLPDGSLSPNASIMASTLQKMFRQQAIQNKEADIPNPYETAFAQVEQYFANIKPTTRGWPNNLPTSDQLTTINSQIESKRNETDEFIVRGVQSLDEQDTFFSAVEISEALKGYGKPGWQPHERAVYVANQYGIDPLTVIQKQARAYDPKADMQDVPSIKAFNEKVDKYHKQLLTNPIHANNADGISRAWGTTGEVNYSIFRNADQSKEIGEQLGIPDYAVEAAAELGYLDRDEPLNDEETVNYFKVVYKMSGGTDIRALEQLMRPKFKP